MISRPLRHAYTSCTLNARGMRYAGIKAALLRARISRKEGPCMRAYARTRVTRSRCRHERSRLIGAGDMLPRCRAAPLHLRCCNTSRHRTCLPYYGAVGRKGSASRLQPRIALSQRKHAARTEQHAPLCCAKSARIDNARWQADRMTPPRGHGRQVTSPHSSTSLTGGPLPLA